VGIKLEYNKVALNMLFQPSLWVTLANVRLFFKYLIIAENSCNFGSWDGKSAYITFLCPYGSMESIKEFGIANANGNTTCPKDQ